MLLLVKGATLVKVDQSEVNQRVQNYLATPEGQKLIEGQTLSLILGVGIAGLKGLGAIFCAATIRFVFTGVRLAWSAVTFSDYRSQTGPKFLKRRDEVVALIGYPIIVGPERSEGVHCGLVLGSFTAAPGDVLERLSEDFGNLYTGERNDPGAKRLLRLLRDDSYTENRRRLVPQEFSEGYELYLFDAELKLADCYQGTNVRAAYAALPGPAGPILQVPWSAIESGVRLEPGD